MSLSLKTRLSPWPSGRVVSWTACLHILHLQEHARIDFAAGRDAQSVSAIPVRARVRVVEGAARLWDAERNGRQGPHDREEAMRAGWGIRTVAATAVAASPDIFASAAGLASGPPDL